MSDQADELRRISALNKQKNTRIITIASGKGGVGKSNIAVNLAIALSDLNKRVLVLDADLGLANINVILGVLPKFNLYHLIQEEKPIREIIVRVPEGIEIIAGASGFTQLANLSPEKRDRLISELSTLDSMDYIIIDASPGISSNVLNFIEASDDTIIITTSEPTSVTDAYGIIKAITTGISTSKDIKLIVNRVKDLEEGRKVSDRICSIAYQFLNIKITRLGSVFEDPNVSKSIYRQEPFYRAYPGSRASLCIKHLAYAFENVVMKTNGTNIKDFLTKLFKLE